MIPRSLDSTTDQPEQRRSKPGRAADMPARRAWRLVMTYGRPPYFVISFVISYAVAQQGVISYAVAQQGVWANLTLIGRAS